MLIRTVTGRATDADVEAVDVTDPLNPVTLSTEALPEVPQALAVNGFQAAVALGASGVQVIDYTDPTDPAVTSFSTSEPAYDVTAPGVDDVFVVAFQDAIELIHRTTGQRGRYDFITIAPDVFITGVSDVREVVLRGGSTRRLFYVTVSVGSVFVIDATDETAPFLVGEYSDPTLYPTCVTATSNAVFVGDVLVGDRILALPPQDPIGGAPTGVTAGAAHPASRELLGASWPNPFTSTTRIPFSLARPTHVELAVYDVSGRLVRRLAQGRRGVGQHDVTWDGRDDLGRRASSGVYFVRLQAGERRDASRLIRVH